MKSNCCFAPIRTENDEGTTSWMVCENCKKACDLKCTCEEFHCNECGPKELKNIDKEIWDEEEFEKLKELLTFGSSTAVKTENTFFKRLKSFIRIQVERAREEGIKIGLKQAVSAMENVLNNQKP